MTNSLAYERRILSLEIELQKVIEAAGRLASIIRRNTPNLNDALVDAQARHKQYRRAFAPHLPEEGFPVEKWMPALIEVEKVIAEATGLDTDDNWVRKCLTEPEPDIAVRLRACVGNRSSDGKYPQLVPDADLILSAASAIEAAMAAETTRDWLGSRERGAGGRRPRGSR